MQHLEEEMFPNHQNVQSIFLHFWLLHLLEISLEGWKRLCWNNLWPFFRVMQFILGHLLTNGIFCIYTNVFFSSPSIGKVCSSCKIEPSGDQNSCVSIAWDTPERTGLTPYSSQLQFDYFLYTSKAKSFYAERLSNRNACFIYTLCVIPF